MRDDDDDDGSSDDTNSTNSEGESAAFLESDEELVFVEDENQCADVLGGRDRIHTCPRVGRIQELASFQ